MNQFTEQELIHAVALAKVVMNAVCGYAQPQDTEAAAIALLELTIDILKGNKE